jgi:hypothetical protein
LAAAHALAQTVVDNRPADETPVNLIHPQAGLAGQAAGARRPHRSATADRVGLPGARPGAVRAVFSPHHCPARGHRVNGGPAGRRLRSATPTIDPATAHEDMAPIGRTGKARNMAGAYRQQAWRCAGDRIKVVSTGGMEPHLRVRPG